MSEPRLKIVVDKGPSLGTEMVLRDGTFAIGRDPRGDLVLSDDEFVSNQHATIVANVDGVVLRNLSQNGTLVNGRPIMETSLAAGDIVSVGMRHLLAVRPYVRPAPPRRTAVVAPVPSLAAASGAKAVATTGGFHMPTWLVAYLVLMGIAFVFFAIMKATSAGTPGLAQIQMMEQQYAAEHKLPVIDTTRVLRLLETAVVHERRGDARSAYEAYRETLGARRPPEPESPAYRYAASRVAELGPKNER